MPSRRRAGLKIGLAILVVALLAITLRSGAPLPVNDFVEYWAAARLAVDGQDPYSPSAMLALEEQAVGYRFDKPLMMWNPPYVLPFVLPFALLSLTTARAVMALVAFVMIFGAAELLWRLYADDVNRRWMAWVVTATFAPVFATLAAGQISPFVLLGVVAFLWFERRGQHFASGASLLLVAFKPHLLYLIWIAIALWIVEKRRWTVLAGAVTAVVLALAAAFAADPHIWTHYAPVWRTGWMLALYAPPPGGLLRAVFGWDRYWLQFAPVLVGVGWLAWRRWSTADFDLVREFPLLLLVSICTSPYGWVFDQVVLLPAVVQRVVQSGSATINQNDARLWTAVWLAGNALGFVHIVTARTMLSLNFVWVAPFYVAVYAATHAWTRRHEESRHADCPPVEQSFARLT
jgi:Glycosyltransferase family 87